METVQLLNNVRSEIRRRTLPYGGWASGTSRRADVEVTCLALLALQYEVGIVEHGRNVLRQLQNPNGSWPAFAGDDSEGCWTTSLAVIALGKSEPVEPIQSAVQWVLTNKGRESNWLWNLKFRFADRKVQFDPNKYGWPWIPGTVSWVIPSAFALIALKQVSTTCCQARVTERVRLGTEMLLDRRCPQGGWNAGNGIVLGSPLKPHLDTTAIALIALADSPSDPSTQALSWLRLNWRLCASPYGLAWAAVALDAQRNNEFALCVQALERSLSRIAELNTETLSVSSIALAIAEGEPNPFQTVIR